MLWWLEAIGISWGVLLALVGAWLWWLDRSDYRERDWRERDWRDRE